MKKIKIKRIYDEASGDDGYRVLVDRLWPRGISKKDAHLDEWNKEIAPSSELRKWFDHEESRFDEFTHRYREELKAKENELKELQERTKDKAVCLLYAAKETEFNQAVVLKDVLMEKG